MNPAFLRRADRRDDGFTAVEMSLTLIVVATTALGALSLTVSTMGLEAKNREFSSAVITARLVFEQLDATPFAEVFPRFNADPADDPGGAGTAPGETFEVSALTGGYVMAPFNENMSFGGAGGGGPADSPDVDWNDAGLAFTVDVRFPVDGGGRLVEGVNLITGMPLDLNGDGIVEPGVDRSADYRLLPVRVRVSWSGASGPDSLELSRIITMKRNMR